MEKSHHDFKIKLGKTSNASKQDEIWHRRGDTEGQRDGDFPLDTSWKLIMDIVTYKTVTPPPENHLIIKT